MSDALTRESVRWRAERDAEERLRQNQPKFSSLATLAGTPAPELLPLAIPTPPARPYPVGALCPCFPARRHASQRNASAHPAWRRNPSLLSRRSHPSGWQTYAFPTVKRARSVCFS